MKLIFDGNCGFCTSCAEFGRERLAQPGHIVPWQEIPDLSVYGLTKADVKKRAYFVDDNDKVTGGAKALLLFGRFMKRPYSFLARILLIPGIPFLLEPLYKLVAKNRHRFPGDGKVCLIDLDPEDHDQ